MKLLTGLLAAVLLLAGVGASHAVVRGARRSHPAHDLPARQAAAGALQALLPRRPGLRAGGAQAGGSFGSFFPALTLSRMTSRPGRSARPFSRPILLCMGLFSRFWI